MLDIKFIRENKDIVIAGAKKKHIGVDIERLIELDDQRRALQLSLDEGRATQNQVSREMPSAAKDRRETLLLEMKNLKETLTAQEEKMTKVMHEWRALMVQVPNVPDVSVPEGDSDADNKEIRSWGDRPTFDFEPKNHVELMLRNDMADFERGAKVAGFRGYFLKGDGARLVWALEQFVQSRFTGKDFTPMIVPSLVRREPFVGTGYLPQSEEDLYRTQDGDYLAGTAEVASMGFYMDEILEKKDLPVKFFSFSPCFRREAGSHGKDTKGVFRIHEFVKYEQVVLCEADHQTSVKFHEELTGNSEKLLQELKLPYRVVVNCGGDLGLGQVKKYDIETWMPSEGTYRETHSSSYFHDFQTRRLNIRYRDEEGTVRYAHSLNNTALALPRILCQIVENYQQEDGSIEVPDALRPYMGNNAIGKGSDRIIDLRERKAGGRAPEQAPLPLRPQKRVSPVRVRRRRVRLIVFSIACSVLVSGALILSRASYLPQYSVGPMTVEGAQNVSSDLIIDYAQSIIYNGSHDFLSRANIFLYPKALIEKDIPLEFPRIESATISSPSLLSNAVAITVVERQPFALWCSPAVEAGDQGGTCYDMDQNGFIFAQGAQGASSSGEYIFSGGVSTSSPPIGQTFALGHTQGLVAFLQLLGQAGYTPLGATVQSDQDFTVPLSQGFSVYASFGEDAGALVSNLQLVLSSDALAGQEQDLEYVDLRFGDKVYYKLKGQDEASTTPQ